MVPVQMRQNNSMDVIAVDANFTKRIVDPLVFGLNVWPVWLSSRDISVFGDECTGVKQNFSLSICEIIGDQRKIDFCAWIRPINHV